MLQHRKIIGGVTQLPRNYEGLAVLSTLQLLSQIIITLLKDAMKVKKTI